MTETIKVNLSRTHMLLRITGIVAGALIACFVCYNQLDQRMDNIEKAEAVKQAKLEYMEKEIGKVGGKVDKVYEYLIKSSPSSDHSSSNHLALRGK